MEPVKLQRNVHILPRSLTLTKILVTSRLCSQTESVALIIIKPINKSRLPRQLTVDKDMLPAQTTTKNEIVFAEVPFAVSRTPKPKNINMIIVGVGPCVPGIPRNLFIWDVKELLIPLKSPTTMVQRRRRVIMITTTISSKLKYSMLSFFQREQGSETSGTIKHCILTKGIRKFDVVSFLTSKFDDSWSNKWRYLQSPNKS